MSDYEISSIEQLTELYGEPVPGALIKEIDYISDHYRAFIEASPFVIVATSGAEGLDCSPRGDPAGFVRVMDDKTVLLPDRRGNNRLDSLKNIVSNGQISLLFLIPGVGETLRINGHAALTTDPQLCESFVMQGKAPRSVIKVTADRVYFQCPKALVRSKLWDPNTQVPRSMLPTSGQIMQGLRPDEYDAAKHDAAYPERLKKTIY